MIARATTTPPPTSPPTAATPSTPLGSLAAGLALACLVILQTNPPAGANPLDDTIAVDGICVPLRTATITSPVQEIIEEMLVEEGAQVEPGQVLVRLRSSLQEIAVERATRILEKKEFDFNAAESLSADRIVSRERVLNAEIDLALAQVDLQEARHLLDERTIAAPFEGFIIRRYKEPGESIDRMEPLYAIVNVDVLTLQFFVEPAVAARLSIGDTIPFTASTDQPPPAALATIDDGLADSRVNPEPGDGTGLAPAAGDNPEPAGNSDDDDRQSVHFASLEFISPAADPSSGLVRISLQYTNDGHQVRAGTRVTAHVPAP